MTLVALFAMTTGAWAQVETLLTTITPTGEGTYSETTAGAVTVTPAGSFFYSGSSYGWRWDSYGTLTVTANEGYTITRCVFIQQGKNQSVTISEAPFELNFEEWVCLENTSMDGVTSIEVYGTAPVAEETVTLNHSANNTWAIAEMPYYDVELEVEYETELALSETTDNSAALTEWDGYEADVTLTRTLATGSWNTFAAPFSTAIPEGWTVKELSSATFADGTLTLNFANAASIVAGKPYLVKVAANTDLSAAPFTEAIVSKDAQPFTSTDVDFIPTLGATTIPDGDTKAVLFLAANNTLLNPSALPANMKGFRAYFQLKGETASLARAFSIDFGDGETTGIIAIGTDRAASTDNATYTLDGRRISKATQKGVYIQNGKKVIIRSATQGDACQSKK